MFEKFKGGSEAPGGRKGEASRVKTLSAVAAASVAVALLCACYGIWSSMGAQSAIDAARVGTAPTLVASTEIKAGQPLEASMFEVKDVPEAYRAQGALDAAALSGDGAVTGHLALSDIAQGAQLTPAMVAGSGAATTVSAALGEGMEAVSIAVDSEAGVAGNLIQGDTVRIVSVATTASGEAVASTLASGVRVVALDSSLSGSTGAYVSVTVEVAPEVADAVRAAQAVGNVALALEPRVG